MHLGLVWLFIFMYGSLEMDLNWNCVERGAATLDKSIRICLIVLQEEK